MIPNSVKVGPEKKDVQFYYENNTVLIIPSSILRKKSPSAENKKNFSDEISNKFKNVLIKKIESVGNYAIRIHFSDGHNTGIFSWEYLFSLGKKLNNL